MTTSDNALAVRHTTHVPLPAERAFTLFTARMSEFWPRSHSIGTTPLAEVVLEPREGGRWFERGIDGAECPWGTVRIWSPPERLVLVWQLGPDWSHDPALDTEVEVTFHAEETGHTRVELIHRLDGFGERAGSVGDVLSSPTGWPAILEAYRAAAR